MKHLSLAILVICTVLLSSACTGSWAEARADRVDGWKWGTVELLEAHQPLAEEFRARCRPKAQEMEGERLVVLHYTAARRQYHYVVAVPHATPIRTGDQVQFRRDDCLGSIRTPGGAEAS